MKSRQHFIGGQSVITEAPDGSLHGMGSVVASADAVLVRPQDCSPAMRALLFHDAMREREILYGDGTGRKTGLL